MEDSGASRIDLNTASVRELTQLPRVGIDKARRIVRYRAVRKGFRDWDDFGRVSGLRAEDVAAIRPRATIGAPLVSAGGERGVQRRRRPSSPIRWRVGRG